MNLQGTVVPRWPKRLTVMLLCFLATFVCFLDRVNMSVAAIAMQEEFGWSETTKGLVLSSFFVGYLIFQVPSGWLTSRFGGRHVMAIAIIWWSAFTILTPLAAAISLPLLMVARIGMGLGEAATFPAAYYLGARWFLPAERSRFVGVLLTGIPAGTLFALLTTGSLIRAWGWQSVFFAFGTFGLVICALWFTLIRNSPAEHPRISLAERALLTHMEGKGEDRRRSTPWKELLSQPPVWALVLNHFCSNWILYVLLTWLPSYFMQTQKLNIVSAGLYSAAPWLSMVVTGNLATALADRMVRRGFNVTLVRKLFQLIALIGAAAALLTVRGVTDSGHALLLMCAALGFLGLTWAGFSPNHLEIAPRHADVLVGLSNTAGTIPGAIGVAVTGWLVDRTGSFDSPFFAAACIGAAGALIWLCFATGKRIVD